MPTISMFYGIIIYIYYFDNEQHNIPHIHAHYQDQKAAISINDGIVLAGELSSKQLKLVQAWIEIHKDELLADWKLAISGEQVFRIDPLK
jgi:hypothetical protein